MKKQNIIKLYLKYQLIIFPVLVILASIFLIVFVIFPQITKLISNNQAITKINQIQKLLEVKALELESLDEDELSKKLSVSLVALPQDKDFVQTVGIIQGVFIRSGFDLISLQIGSPPAGSLGASAFSLKAEISGSTIALASLLSDIENAPRVMKIASLEVNQSRTADLVSASLSMIAFYAPAPQTLGSIDAPLPKLTEEDERLITTLAKTTPPQRIGEAAPQVFGPSGKEDPFE